MAEIGKSHPVPPANLSGNRGVVEVTIVQYQEKERALGWAGGRGNVSLCFAWANRASTSYKMIWNEILVSNIYSWLIALSFFPQSKFMTFTYP
jgi:hypothetical protein